MVFGAALGAALVLVGGAAAKPRSTPTPLLDTVSATLSSSHAGARPVALTLAIRMEVQCGRLVGGTLAVRLPAQERLPPKVASGAVLVGGKPAGAVTVAGHTLTVSIPLAHTIMCDSIGPGTVTMVVTRAANLGNPKAAGKYPLVVLRGNQQFKTLLTISS